MRLLFCALSILIAPICAFSADQARLPYTLIAEIQKSQAKVSQTHTNLQIVLRMRSTEPEVKPEDLRVFIASKTGQIPVGVDREGNFTVPIRDSLINENPWIVVNQPKGTMKLEWNVGVVGHHPYSGIHYQELMRPLQEVQSISKEIAIGGSKLSIIGLRLVFPAEKDATVTIHARAGDKVLKGGQTHAVVVPLEPPLFDENPEIAFSEAPLRIEVATRADEN